MIKIISMEEYLEYYPLESFFDWEVYNCWFCTKKFPIKDMILFIYKDGRAARVCGETCLNCVILTGKFNTNKLEK
jgi:ribosomal protein L24E